MLEKTGIALNADMLPFINRFPPWKTVIYLLISAVIHYLERLIDFWRETGGFIAGNQKLPSEIVVLHAALPSGVSGACLRASLHQICEPFHEVAATSPKSK